MRAMAQSVVAVAVFSAALASAGVSDSSAPLRSRVLAFAQANLGKTVGNGECAALAFQGLRAAGARPRARHGFPTDRDYVWGEQVLLIEATPDGPKLSGSIRDVHPGDIAQFSNAHFVSAHFGHHTAIVESIDEKHLTLLHQNIGGKRVVFQGAVRIDRLSAGWVRFYSPVPADS
jgi:hypothetical protein